MVYDETQHLHIGYYENGLDFEAVGLKQVENDVWDIYFNFLEHNLDEPSINFHKVEPFGCKILSISKIDLSSEEAAEYFKIWIEKEVKK